MYKSRRHHNNFCSSAPSEPGPNFIDALHHALSTHPAIALEEVMEADRPDLIVVVGDGKGILITTQTSPDLAGPTGYMEFLKTQPCLVTVSGCIQEETTFLHVPCLMLRPNTERPVTITLGTHELMPLDFELIVAAAERAFSENWKTGTVPPLWDGHAAERIAADLVARFGG